MKLSLLSAHLGKHSTSDFLINLILFMFTLNIYFVTPMTMLLILSLFYTTTKGFHSSTILDFCFALAPLSVGFWWRFRGAVSANRQESGGVSNKAHPPIVSRYSDSLRVARSGDRISVWRTFPAPVQTGPGAHPASFSGNEAAGAWR